MDPSFRYTNGRRTAAVSVPDDLSSSSLWRRRAEREARGLGHMRSEPRHHGRPVLPQNQQAVFFPQPYYSPPPMNMCIEMPNGVNYGHVCTYCYRNEEYCMCREEYFSHSDEYEDYSSGVDSGLGEPMTPSTASSSFESLTSDEDQEALRDGFEQLSRYVPDLSSPDKQNPYTILRGAIRKISNMSKILEDRKYGSTSKSPDEFSNCSDSDAFGS